MHRGRTAAGTPAGLFASARRLRAAKARALHRSWRRHLRLAAEWLEPRCLLATLASPLGDLPLSFEVNSGQTDSQVDFLAHGNGYTIFLTPSGATLALNRVAQQSVDEDQPPPPAPTTALRVELVGGQAAEAGLGLEELPSKSNYFL